MKKRYNYTPMGVCSRNIEIEVDGDIITDVKFTGGCDGNLQGIARLVVGRSIESVSGLLAGVDCRGRGTSCPDQLAIALRSLPKE